MDKKKIKEAAKKYGKRMMASCNEFAKKHESTIPTVGIVSIAPDVAFQDGVKWAINEFMKDLWHDASEKPVMSEHGMIIVELNDITACKYSLWRSITTYECLCNNKGYIRRWLYLDEIIKTD